MNEKYRRILTLPHFTSQRHPPMSREERAAQFSPFAALSGFEEAIEERRKESLQRLQEEETLQEEE